MSTRRALLVAVVALSLSVAASSSAQPPPASAPSASAAPAKAPAQGVAVVASGANARDDAFAVARAMYATSLRPRQLDELRARILAGDPAPESAGREIRDLAELRASIVSENAASRQLLASIAQQVHAQALLVVSRATPAPAAEGEAADAGAPAPSSPVTARLFLAESGEFDAARYEPETTAAGEGTTWRGIVSSLAARFPPPAAEPTAQLQGPPPKIMPTKKESEPFYKSGWLWVAVSAAAVIGGVFFIASQDTSDDPIHLQMRVPR